MKRQAAKRKEQREMAEERQRLIAAGDKDALAHARAEHEAKMQETAARQQRLKEAAEKSDSDSD